MVWHIATFIIGLTALRPLQGCSKMAESGISTMELVIIIVIIAIVPIVNVAIYKTRYKRVSSDKAMVIYGRMMPGSERGYEVLSDGGKFIIPIVEECMFLDLKPRSAKFELRSVKAQLKDRRWGRASGRVDYTYRVTKDAYKLMTAAEHLLGLDPADVSRMVEGYVEAALRAWMACGEFPASREDQEVYERKMMELLQTDLNNIGMELVHLEMDKLKLIEGG
jgi:uncharacterized membrane protein YqiK